MLWGVHAATGGTGRFSRVVAGGQAQLVVLSCSNEEEWDGGRAGWSPAMVHSRHRMGALSVGLSGAFSF